MDVASEATERQRAPAGRSSRNLLIGAAVVAVMIAIVIAITGGFVIDAGPLYLSAHRLWAPLSIAAVAYAVALRRGRAAIVAADDALLEFLNRHALSIVVILSALAAAVGVAFGTYVASGADSSAYLSQARLLARGELVESVPLASNVTWPEPEWSFAPLGYRPGLHAVEIVPTYPPGLPLVMAAASLIAGDTAPFLIGPFFAVLTVLSTYSLATRLHSRTAGAIAAALMASSPLMLSQVVQQMSDIPATALWTLALLAAISARALTAGAVSGFAVLMRPSLLPVAGAVALALTIWSGRTPDSRHGRAVRLVRFSAAMAPGIAALAWIQWSLYGHPLASGHGAFSELFAMANVLPNVHDYTMRALTGETPALVLIAAAIVISVAWRHVPAGLQTKTRPTPALRPSARVAALVAIPVLACYLAYGVFPDWAYLRFLLPIWPAALVAAGAVIANATLQLPATVRAQILLVALTAVCARNVITARNEGSFTLWIDASRYGTAGRYLAAALPKNAVIVTAQHSGSASYYTGRPILRWDSLHIGLDEAISDLTRLGRSPVLLVEDWEQAALARKFPESSLARLDWPARADFGWPTRVRLFDPVDRTRPTNRPPDRLP